MTEGLGGPCVLSAAFWRKVDGTRTRLRTAKHLNPADYAGLFHRYAMIALMMSVVASLMTIGKGPAACFARPT